MQTGFSWAGVGAAAVAIATAILNPTPPVIGAAVLAVFNLFVKPPTKGMFGLGK